MRVPLRRIACFLVVATAAAPLLGCGVFESVTMAAYAVNGVSYASTGKSVMDHAASYGTGKDCALLRAARDEDICRDDEMAKQAKQEQPIDSLEAIAPASANWMLVLGTYADAHAADDELRRYRALEPFVVAETVEGRVVRRIVAGPYGEKDLKLYRSARPARPMRWRSRPRLFSRGRGPELR
jgi:hypothetical protein